MPTACDEIERVIREILGPLLRADGGVLYLVSVADDSVSLHLAGRFAGCPGNTLAKRRIIEPAIHAVAPGAQVTITAGALVPEGARTVGD
jgi:Fe-S cluster biogenesis protein NfuA